jgi:aspartyl-tRNA(Asn)/glutamyl-tRNA(Gln) amidotransferase subunit A
MCVMALGSDTRGSIRGPSALCGVTGFKPTMERVSREGAFPLSYTLDSIGPLTNSAACCAAYDAVLSGEAESFEPDLKGLRLLLPRCSAIEDLDRDVAAAFENSLKILGKSGASIVEIPVPAFDRQAEYFKGGGFAGAEAYYIHRERLDRLAEFDPRVGKRVVLGKDLTGADYVSLGFLRKEFQQEIARLMAGFDAFLIPSAPCIAPPIAEADASDEAYFRWNGRLLRNHGLANFLDGCALSLPCHEPGSAPVGLMVCGLGGTDRRLLGVAAAIERALPRR